MRAGNLSLEISMSPVGRPHHFTKLLGGPKLVLKARHRDLTRWSASAAWALLCLVLAAALARAMARPQTGAVLRRRWPWLAISVGTAWWFLLPGGFAGLALVLAGLVVLAWRTRPVPRIGGNTTAHL